MKETTPNTTLFPLVSYSWRNSDMHLAAWELQAIAGNGSYVEFSVGLLVLRCDGGYR
jgi:hypothetical protein